MIAFYGDKKFSDLYNMNRLKIQNDIVLHIEDIRQENLRHIIIYLLYKNGSMSILVAPGHI